MTVGTIMFYGGIAGFIFIFILMIIIRAVYGKKINNLEETINLD